MSLTFTDNRTFATTANSVLLDNQQTASISFWFRYELNGSLSFGYSNPLIRQSSTGFSVVLRPGTNAVTLQLMFANTSGQASLTTFTLDLGTTYHVAAVWSQSGQTAWLNAISAAMTPTQTGPLATGSRTFTVGNNPYNAGTGCIYTMEDVAIWNGYALSASDVKALRDRTLLPPDIGASATARFRWTLSGSNGANATVGDTGLVEYYGQTAYNLVTASGTGTAVYGSQMQYTVPVQISQAHVGTSGKTVFLFPTSVSSGLWTAITSISTDPTITINGVNKGSLVNLWNTQKHACIGYQTPPGVVVNPGDTVTIDAPSFWALTSSGEVAPLSSYAVVNNTGKSCFGSESGATSLKMGVNFSDLGTSYYTMYQLFRDWRRRITNWSNVVSATIDGYPTQLSSTTSTAFIHNPGAASNGLDGTSYPGPSGLFAVGWDDPNGTDTFALIAGNSRTTVTERTDLQNPGDAQGRGKVRVFNVQLASGAASVDTAITIQLTTTSPTKTPTFQNLHVYGPGDFSYTANQPVTLDTDDQTELSAVMRDWLSSGIGSARFMDSLLSWIGISGLTEPEQIRQWEDFSWSVPREIASITYTQLRPFSPSANTYIYASFLGQPYNVTLNTPVASTPAPLTQETWSLSAIDSPVLRGLILMDAGEKMRIVKVNGDGTFLVERGSLGTTPVPHAAGTIQCSGRMLIDSFAKLGSGYIVGEWVTQSPHNLVSGTRVQNTGNWPDANAPTYTVGGVQKSLKSTSNGGVAGPYTYNTTNAGVLVTGPNTFVTWLFNDSSASPVVTIDQAVSLDPTKTTPPYCSSTLNLPDTISIPWSAAAIVASKFDGCKLWVNIPMGAGDALVRVIAQQVLQYLPPGREVWLELANEVWNTSAGPQWSFFSFLSNLAGLATGTNYYPWVVHRGGQIKSIFQQIFGSRAGEIKLAINCQHVGPSTSAAALSAAQTQGVVIDGIATAPYVDPDSSSVSKLAYNQADFEQAIDLWVHDLWHKQTNGYSSMIAGHQSNIDSYNAATGNNCVLVGYEGGYSTGCPSSSTTLNGAINDTTSTTVTVADAVSAGFTAGMYLVVGTEWLYVQNVVGNTLTVTRGANGTTPATHADKATISNAISTHRTRDMQYHPNWRIAEKDMYLFYQSQGFRLFNLYALSKGYGGNPGTTLPYAWGLYTWAMQPHGRGDGSDGKADNRLCLITPGLPNSKLATTSLDGTNVSVRGQALIDWNQSSVQTGGGSGAGSPLITQGLGSTLLLLQGLGVGPHTVVTSSLITQGLGGDRLLTQGFGFSIYTEAVGGGLALGGLVSAVVWFSPVTIGGLDIGGVNSALLTIQEMPIGGVLLGGSPFLPESFLAALVAMLRTNMQLITTIGGPRIYSTFPGTRVRLPFVLIEDYIESQPGETIEHNLNIVEFGIYGSSKAEVRVVGEALKNAVDSPAQNNRSTRTILRWADGQEESCWRRPTLPPIRMRKTDYGTDMYRWGISYDFNINPYFQD